MPAETAHRIVGLGGQPLVLAHHVLHETAAHHHTDDDGAALREVLFHTVQVHHAARVAVLGEALESFDPERHRTLHLLGGRLLGTTLVGVRELTEGQGAVLAHLLHGPLDVAALAVAALDLDLVVHVRRAERGGVGVLLLGCRLHDGACRIGAGPGHTTALLALVQALGRVFLQAETFRQGSVHIIGERLVHLGFVVHGGIHVAAGGELQQLRDVPTAFTDAALQPTSEIQHRTDTQYQYHQ